MNNTNLQVPISKDLKANSLAAAREYGFSSLQELVRVFLTKVARKEISVGIEATPTRLSEKNEKRYLKMDRDFDKGKNVAIFGSVNDLMKDLLA